MSRHISIIVLIISATIAAIGLVGCSRGKTGRIGEERRVATKSIEQVLKEKTGEWMAIPGVEGTAIGLSKGKPCIRIFTSSKPQQLRDKIPSMVEGYRVIIEETGEFRALDQQ